MTDQFEPAYRTLAALEELKAAWVEDATQYAAAFVRQFLALSEVERHIGDWDGGTVESMRELVASALADGAPTMRRVVHVFESGFAEAALADNTPSDQ